MKISLYSNKGLRAVNQDYCTYSMLGESDGIFVVADGMGGYEAGELASQTVGDSVKEYVRTHIQQTSAEDLLRNAFVYANDVLREKEAAMGISKMGTVLVAMLLLESKAYVAWLGDSRFYHYRHGEFLFHTEDHSLINQLKVKDALKADLYERYSAIVTKCIMGDNDMDCIPIETKELQHGDVCILCTDGLHKGMDVSELVAYDDSHKKTLDDMQDKMKDNYSFIKIEF